MSSDPEFLRPDEIGDLTAAKPVDARERWLKEHGIPYRRDGRRLIVCRVHVRAWVEGRPVVSSNGPNWSAVA